MAEHKVPVQSLIDHIKTAVDVDPWAQEMAEELLKKQEPVPPIKQYDGNPGKWESWWYVCGKCEREIDYHDKFCRHCGQEVKWDV